MYWVKLQNILHMYYRSNLFKHKHVGTGITPPTIISYKSLIISHMYLLFYIMYVLHVQKTRFSSYIRFSESPTTALEAVNQVSSVPVPWKSVVSLYSSRRIYNLRPYKFIHKTEPNVSKVLKPEQKIYDFVYATFNTILNKGCHKLLHWESIATVTMKFVETYNRTIR